MRRRLTSNISYNDEIQQLEAEWICHLKRNARRICWHSHFNWIPFAASRYYSQFTNHHFRFSLIYFFRSGLNSLNSLSNGSLLNTINNNNNNHNGSNSSGSSITNNNNSNLLNNNLSSSNETICTTGEQPDADYIKMFVGQVPKSMDEEQLREMFEEFGRVHSINVLRDKVTGVSKGESIIFLLIYLQFDE